MIKLKNDLVFIDTYPIDILDSLMKFNEMHTKILIHHKLELITKKRGVSLPIYQELLNVFNEIDAAFSKIIPKESILCIDYRLSNFPFEYLPAFKKLKRSRTINLTYTTVQPTIHLKNQSLCLVDETEDLDNTWNMLNSIQSK